jgi:hypothetical protein
MGNNFLRLYGGSMTVFGLFESLSLIRIVALCIFGAVVVALAALQFIAYPLLRAAARRDKDNNRGLTAESIQSAINKWLDRLFAKGTFQAVFLVLLTIVFVLIPVFAIFFSNVAPLQKYLDAVFSLFVARIISDLWRVGRENELTEESLFIWRYLPPVISSIIVLFAIVNNSIALLPASSVGSADASPYFNKVNRDVLNVVLVTYLAVRRLTDDIAKRIEKKKYTVQKVGGVKNGEE